MISRYLVGVCLGSLLVLFAGAYGCGGNLKTHEGDVYIERAEQIEEYRAFGRINGRVTITQLKDEAFSWPELVEVGGELWIWENDNLKGFNLAGLEKVDSNVLVRNNSQLTGINFDSLNFVGGSFSFAYNPKLPTCQVNRVISAVGSGNITGETSVVGNNDNGGCE